MNDKIFWILPKNTRNIHYGLLHKSKHFLPYSLFKILESYLSDRHYFIKVKNQSTNIHKIESGVP